MGPERTQRTVSENMSVEDRSFNDRRLAQLFRNPIEALEMSEAKDGSLDICGIEHDVLPMTARNEVQLNKSEPR